VSDADRWIPTVRGPSAAPVAGRAGAPLVAPFGIPSARHDGVADAEPEHDGGHATKSAASQHRDGRPTVGSNTPKMRIPVQLMCPPSVEHLACVSSTWPPLAGFRRGGPGSPTATRLWLVGDQATGSA